jgi:ATP-binding cassette subfamily B protein
MQLKKELPEDVSLLLANSNIKAEDILLATDTELDVSGNYAREWLIVTPRRILRVSEEGRDYSGRPEIALDIPTSLVNSARIDGRVGSSFLELEIDGGFEEVIRFTNTNAERFGKVTVKLNEYLKGHSIIITEEDDGDSKRCPTCGRIVTATGGVCPNCIDKGAVFIRFLKLMKPYWPTGLLLFVLLMIGITLDLLPPRLTKMLVDNVFGTQPPSEFFMRITQTLNATSRISWLAILVASLVLAQLLRVAINITNGLLASKMGTKIAFDLRQKLYERLQEFSISYYDRNQAGQLMTRVTQDVEELQGFVWQVTNGFIVNIFLLVGIGIMLFTMNPRLAFYILLPTPLVVGSTYVYWRFVLPRYRRFRDRRAKLNNVLYASLSGVRVVKAFGQEEREAERFKEYSGDYRAAKMGIDRANNIFHPIVGFIFGLGGLIVWYLGGKDVLDDTITLGTLMAFLSYLGMFYGPLSQLINMSQWMTSFMTAAHRMFDILDTEPEIVDAPDAIKIDVEGEIEFSNVTFGYFKHNPILRDMNLKINAGEMIGIVGPSGSGKSTLVNLICRFYDPDDGVVTIDGVDLRKIERECLREQIGIVLQEPYLFRGSIADNIAYGRPDASFEEIMDAAKAANAHDFIVRLADGYDTQLGERGSGLSGGERQRVSIARALLCDPKILILDEATSSVDTESERAIQEALSVLTKGRTTIAIAHRLSTLRNSDRIIVMEDGAIKEMGSHAELMELGGLYHRLVTIQLQLTKDTESIATLLEESKARQKAVG